MEYLKIYNTLINSAKSKDRKKKKGGIYYEKHHIRPVCIGGDNSPSNLVLLTAKEHYMAHKLLCEIYPESNSLRYAFWLMINSKSKGQQRYKTCSRVYEYEKLKFAEMQKENIKGKPHSLKNPEMIKKCTQAKILAKVKRPDLSENNKIKVQCPHCNKIGPIFNMRRWHFDNCYVYTGIKKSHPQIECPHCGMKSQPSNIRRYHMDNCKHKK
jgi:endogenous inhibitor of DNA gyrase (YacG/DUF329 family)